MLYDKKTFDNVSRLLCFNQPEKNQFLKSKIIFKLNFSVPLKPRTNVCSKENFSVGIY